MMNSAFYKLTYQFICDNYHLKK